MCPHTSRVLTMALGLVPHILGLIPRPMCPHASHVHVVNSQSQVVFIVKLENELQVLSLMEDSRLSVCVLLA